MRFYHTLTAFILLLLPMPQRAVSADPTAAYIKYDFEGADALKGWDVNQPSNVRLVTGHNGTQSLEVERPAQPILGSSGISIGLPLKELAGCVVHFQAVARAVDVSTPPHPWSGIKFMLHTAGPSGDAFPEYNATGSFDWKPVDFTAYIPADSTKADLILGLEDSTGKVAFDDIRITVTQRPRPRPAHRPAGPTFTGHDGIPRLRGAMVTPEMTAEDIKVLGTEWGANHARWQLTWGGFPHSPADDGDLVAYDTWIDGRLKHLDDMMPALKQSGIHVLIDLHTPPGGRDGQSNCKMFQEKRFQDHFLKVWDRIAARYKGNAQIWGYDLCNEPVLGSVPDGLMNWHELATAAARRVRKIDPRHAIIVEPDPWADPAALLTFAPIPVSGIVYSVHMYIPHTFTHQGVFAKSPSVHYPGVIDGVTWDKERLRKTLKPEIDYARDYNIQIYIGEFSAIRWAPDHDAEHYLSDCIDIFEESGWDWAYHAFREWDGWSVEHGADPEDHKPVVKETDRELLLRRWFEKNKRNAY